MVEFLNPRFLAQGAIDDGGLEAAALRPAQVHALQHLCPVLGIDPAGAGEELHDGVAVVVLSGDESSNSSWSNVARITAKPAATSAETLVSSSSSASWSSSKASATRRSRPRQVSTVPLRVASRCMWERAALESSQNPGAVELRSRFATSRSSWVRSKTLQHVGDLPLQLLKPVVDLAHSRHSIPPPQCREPPHLRQRPRNCLAARTTLVKSMARVIRPTPPGTGVMARATCTTASKSTSPARR